MAELVFIHGAGDSAAVWGRQVDHFAAEHQVLALDLPGHGRRLREPVITSHDENADIVARTIRDGGLHRPVLVGHSMGGAVALTVALRHPDLLRKLVVVGSGARLRIAPHFIEAARAEAQAAPDHVAGSSIELDEAVSARIDSAVRAWLQARVGQATARANYADFLATDRFDVMGRLGEINIPTLVIAGEEDRLTPPKYQHFLAERLPRAELVLLPNAGHYVQAEQAAAFNRELGRFLAQ